MPAELRARVDGAYDSKWKWEEAWKTKAPKGKNMSPPPLTGDFERDFPAKTPGSKPIPPPPGFVLLSEPVSFPNGAVLQVHVAKEGDTEPDFRVADAYWAVVKSTARAEQWTRVWQMALVWLIPCLTLYAFGWAIAWVRRGFRSDDPRGAKGKN